MRYVPSDKYTIAWFKLAECVAKGEKEKAFGVYRLLMHSFDDQAYAYQLEGDLLGAFQDQRAIEKYAHAAHLYAQNNRFKEAATLYHDLIAMAPDDKHHIIRLIEVYKKHKSHDVLIAKLAGLADNLVEQNRPLHAIIIARELEEMSHQNAATSIYIQSILHLSKNNEVSGIEDQVAHAIHYLTKQGDAHQLQNLLSVLEQTNAMWYKHVKKLLHNI